MHNVFFQLYLRAEHAVNQEEAGPLLRVEENDQNLKASVVRCGETKQPRQAEDGALEQGFPHQASDFRTTEGFKSVITVFFVCFFLTLCTP